MLAVALFAAVATGEGEVSIVEAAAAVTAITSNDTNICGCNNRGGGVPLLVGKVQWEIVRHGDDGRCHTDGVIRCVTCNGWTDRGE